MSKNKKVLLTDISISQIDKELAKLQILAPTTFKVEGRVKLLRCSKVFNRYLEDYEDSDINAVFDSKGVFIDFETVDQNVSGLFPVALPKGYK